MLREQGFSQEFPKSHEVNHRFDLSSHHITATCFGTNTYGAVFPKSQQSIKYFRSHSIGLIASCDLICPAKLKLENLRVKFSNFQIPRVVKTI